MAEKVELSLIFSYEETARLRTLRFRAPAEYLAAYQVPGQYCQLAAAPDTKPLFIAFAAAPGNQSYVEFLLRRGGETVEKFLTDVAEKERAWATAAEGKGFASAEAGDKLLLIAAGSGIAPLRALIDHHLATDATRHSITLFYGERTSEDFAYTSQFADWAARGVKIYLCGSAELPGSKHDGLHIYRHHGHIQGALQPLLAQPGSAGSVVYLCGMSKMIEQVKAELAAAGVQKVFLNY